MDDRQLLSLNGKLQSRLQREGFGPLHDSQNDQAHLEEHRAFQLSQAAKVVAAAGQDAVEGRMAPIWRFKQED